jgi:transcriptional regulator with XRE-family HTH domain
MEQQAAKENEPQPQQRPLVRHSQLSKSFRPSAVVLDEVIGQTGWSAYELAQHTGLNRATICRILNGQRGVSFDLLAEGLERAGFQLRLESMSPGQTIPEDELHAILAYFHRPPSFEDLEQGVTWSTLKALCSDLIHAHGVQHQRIAFTRAITRINTSCWIAFLAGLYRFLRWDIAPLTSNLLLVPPWRYGLETWWSPLPSAVINHLLHRYEEPFNDSDYAYRPLPERGLSADQRRLFNADFLEYSVLIPADDFPQRL